MNKQKSFIFDPRVDRRKRYVPLVLTYIFLEAFINWLIDSNFLDTT